MAVISRQRLDLPGLIEQVQVLLKAVRTLQKPKRRRIVRNRALVAGAFAGVCSTAAAVVIRRRQNGCAAPLRDGTWDVVRDKTSAEAIGDPEHAPSVADRHRTVST